MDDPRNSLFSDIHRIWLKPLGFRKISRKSTKDLGNEVTLTVSLESYPATPGGPYRFSLEVRARWNDCSVNDITYCVYLPLYVENSQFWSVDESTNITELSSEVKRQFEAVAVPAIAKMHSLDGMLMLFREVPSKAALLWYYESYLHLLDRLGMKAEAVALLQRVIATAPHKGVEERARSLLAQYTASS